MMHALAHVTTNEVSAGLLTFAAGVVVGVAKHLEGDQSLEPGVFSSQIDPPGGPFAQQALDGVAVDR